MGAVIAWWCCWLCWSGSWTGWIEFFRAGRLHADGLGTDVRGRQTRAVPRPVDDLGSIQGRGMGE